MENFLFFILREVGEDNIPALSRKSKKNGIIARGKDFGVTVPICPFSYHKTNKFFQDW